jgi:hypothetical protein
MAYTDDAVLAKLSALNETQESIVSRPSPCKHPHLNLSLGHCCPMGDVSQVRTRLSWLLLYCANLMAGDMPTERASSGFSD